MGLLYEIIMGPTFEIFFPHSDVPHKITTALTFEVTESKRGLLYVLQGGKDA